MIELANVPTIVMAGPARPWIVPAFSIVVAPTADPPAPLSIRMPRVAPEMRAPWAFTMLPPPMAMPSELLGFPPLSTPPAPVPSMMPKFTTVPVRSMSTPSPSPLVDATPEELMNVPYPGVGARDGTVVRHRAIAIGSNTGPVAADDRPPGLVGDGDIVIGRDAVTGAGDQSPGLVRYGDAGSCSCVDGVRRAVRSA